MPDEAKEKFVGLMATHRIPVIEDDIYGDLYFGDTRPRSLASFNSKGDVLYCTSFSKSLAPDLRVGWVIPEKYRNALKNQVSNTARAIARYFPEGTRITAPDGGISFGLS